jgi:DeoR/GlpR family transcriptional regulator of sugar metabolism
MSPLPSERQEQILEWLREQHTLSIDTIADRLHVSAMTIHRDLNELARTGMVEKVHGGVALAAHGLRSADPGSRACGLCDMPVSTRTTVLIQTEREQFYACCPHCGFLMLDDLSQVSSVLVRDFIYGRMVNALNATFVLESHISLCCMPSTLAFASSGDAERFQRGFDGWTATFDEARQFLLQQHNTHPA